jgi:hypothetical protein
LHHFCRTIPNGGGFTDWREAVGFYHLAIVHFRTKTAFNRILVSRQLV